jgi:phosphopantothenate---cysteine ligase (CTP)
MQKRILITGGPVHAYIDAVKLVTNRFKGGRMAQMANDFVEQYECDVTYLCTRDSSQPKPHPRMTVAYHDGFDDYREKVKRLAAQHTDVILGAAVANLIPANPIKGKFPSHHYKPGDIIPINFTIAPRIVDEVKAAAPYTNLFGFKLLAGVPHDELIHAAYETLLESGSMAVVAHDAKDLEKKYIVTKERGVHPIGNEGLVAYLWSLMTDTYYRSIVAPPDEFSADEGVFRSEVARWMDGMPELFTKVEGGLLFGTIAMRPLCDTEGFWTTARGKTELSGAVHVKRVDHVERKVHTVRTKATLNAPLLDRIFRTLPNVQSIVHAHHQVPDLPTLPYAPPGSVRDTERTITGSFNIAEHGCFMLFDIEGKPI